MVIFLDVGAHTGETLDVVLHPRLAIDRVYAFEPATVCQKILRGYRDPRLTVLEYGLSNETRTASLHGGGLLGASVYADKHQHGDATSVESIQLQRASDWLRDHTNSDDRILLKLNCEGSECDVLEDLLTAPDLLPRLQSIYVDFDVRKIPSQASREDGVRRALTAAGVPFLTPDDTEIGGAAAVRIWLARTELPERHLTPLQQLRYRAGQGRPLYAVVREVGARIFPTRLYRLLARRFGANGSQQRRPAERRRGHSPT